MAFGSIIGIAFTNYQRVMQMQSLLCIVLKSSFFLCRYGWWATSLLQKHNTKYLSVRASLILQCKAFDTRQKGWKTFIFSSLCCEAIVNTLYFLFILSPSSCTLRLSLGTRSNFWWNLVIHFSWRILWSVYHIFGVCL
jgi:hypothetical protein